MISVYNKGFSSRHDSRRWAGARQGEGKGLGPPREPPSGPSLVMAMVISDSSDNIHINDNNDDTDDSDDSRNTRPSHSLRWGSGHDTSMSTATATAKPPSYAPKRQRIATDVLLKFSSPKGEFMGSWHEKLTLLVNHFSLPILAYPFQGH